MATSLAEIRAKLAAVENKGTGNRKSGNFDKTTYAFWNMEDGTTSVIRFLPDADPNNTFFWAERQLIKLTFSGIKGGDNKPVSVQVPCGEMFGDPCPVLTEVRPWFKDPSMEDMGRKYWKKRSYMFQGMVVKNALAEEEVPENPIRKFVIGPQIFNIIKSALMDPDMESLPTDFMNGVDFQLSKGSKGNYADYGTSKWARKERALTEDELTAIDQHGLFTLKEFLPARPSADQYKAIAEMFEASVNGEVYDPERWAQYYKPYGVDAPQGGGTKLQTSSAPVQQGMAKVAKPMVADITDDDVPFEVEVVAKTNATTSTGKKSADDILAMIRNRSK
jgi:hypothetical protein